MVPWPAGAASTIDRNINDSMTYTKTCIALYFAFVSFQMLDQSCLRTLILRFFGASL